MTLNAASLSTVSHALSFFGLEDVVDRLFHRVDPGVFRINRTLGLVHPVEVLLLHDKAVGSFSDEVVILGRLLAMLDVSEDFQSASEVTLLDLVESVLVILVGELVNHCLPLLKKLGRFGD